MADRAIILADLRCGGNPNRGADAALCTGDCEGRRVQALEDGTRIDQRACGLWIDFGDITNRPLIEAAARTGLTVFIDTRGATLKEVTRAAGWCQLAFRGGEITRAAHRLALPGGAGICLVHGVLNDAPPNLRALQRMAEVAMVPVGFLDESDGQAGPLALAAGADVLVRAAPGFDAWLKAVCHAESLLGARRKLPDAAEAVTARAARRRLVAARDLPVGSLLEAADLNAARPAPHEGEFAPYQLESVIGRVLARPIKAGDPVRDAMLEGAPPAEAAWFVPRPPAQPPQ